MSLTEVLARTPDNVFAVVDGAFYDDLPMELSSAGFPSRALYHGEPAIAGPHLVALRTGSSAQGLLALLGDPPPAVFWSWPGDEESLYRHLRSIGMMDLPKPGTNPDDPEYDAVTFRHADPRSLAALLPVLDADQHLELLGDAVGLVYQFRNRLGEDFIVRVARSGQVFRDRM